MKVMSWFRVLMLTAVVVAPAGKALAHGELISSAPGHDAVVTSPEQLVLNFNEDVRLLRLTLAHGGVHDIDFDFNPSTQALRSFTYELPALMMGDHTVDWTIIGADGHTVNGSFDFVVSDSGEQAEVQENTSGHHHH